MILLNRRPQKFPSDEASLSNKITKCASQMISVKSSEFPAAALALKVCLTLLITSLARPEIFSCHLLILVPIANHVLSVS